MKVTVQYWGQIKKAAGGASETVEIDAGSTTRELVLRLAELHGEGLRKFLLDETGAPRRNLLVVVRDEQSHWDNPTALHDGDTVSLVPPISGGAAASIRR